MASAQAADGADWPSHDPNQDAIALLRAENQMLRQAMHNSQEQCDELRQAYDKLKNDKSKTPGCQAPTPTETVAEGQEFEYKDDRFKSSSLLHQYCAMESLNAEQLCTVDAVLSGMTPDDWWGVQGGKRVHALHVATFYGNAALVRKLLEAEADINVQEKDGEKDKSTSLHVAVWYDRPEVIKVLLEKRANPSILNDPKMKFTPLHFAARLGNKEAVEGILDTARQLKLVEDRNEGWRMTTLDGMRPAIQLACEAGDAESFQLLLEAMEEETAAGSPLDYWKSNWKSKVPDDYWNSEDRGRLCLEKNIEELVSFAFKQRPGIASLLLEHYHDMKVVRALLKDREVEIVTQILQNPSDWKTVLDNFVKDPEQMLAADANHHEKCNRVNFWKQNFTNRNWNRMAFLTGDVRSVRHPRRVLNFAGNEKKADENQKKQLAKELEGTDGLAMVKKFVAIGVIPIDANRLAADDILKAIALDANYSLLQTRFVRAVLDDAWTNVKVWYFFHVFWAFFQVVMTCVVSASLRDNVNNSELPDTGGQVPAVAFILLSMVWLKRLTEELYQLVVYWCSCCRRQGKEPEEQEASTPKSQATQKTEKEKAPSKRCSPPSFSCLMKTVCSFHTALDWFYLSISGLALGFLWPFDGPFNAWPIRRSLIAFYFMLVWLSALYWLRGVAAWGFSEKLLPIIWAMRDTGTFLIVVSFTFAAAVHSYFVLSIPNMPSGLYRAFEKTFRLGFLGDFDLYELEFVDPIFVPGETAGVLEPEDPQPGEDHPFVHLFFYFVAFGITIVQMNLFIGILGSNYDKYSKQASALAARERAQLIRFVRGSVWSSLWCRCPCFGNTKQSGVHPHDEGKKDEEEWLFAVFHDRPADEDE